jgi:long-chain acyl-CoA synthetase
LSKRIGEYGGMDHPVKSQSICEFLANSVARRGSERALGYVKNGELHWRTWQQVADEAAALAATIQAAGVAPGDRVAHVSENRFEWIITDLALHLAGAVHVPIHVTLSGEQIAEQIIDCGARLVFVSSQEMMAKFVGGVPAGAIFFVHDEQRERCNKPLLGKPAVAPSLPAPRPQSLATILYTSGTTGRSRGVMLSHANLASNAAATADAFGDDHPELRLCVLPLSHIYARTCDLYTWLYRGTQLVLDESRETLARDLQLVRPAALNAVPYIYQKIADRVRTSDGDRSQVLRDFFGGRIEQLNGGGAPLAPETEAWYAEQGLPILMGYGLTETSPVVAASTPKSHRPGTVGKLLADVEVRIAPDGEILVRGPNVMLGYWHDEAATANAIRDGWFHTGDLGELDADGFLLIRGRKKELIVLSTGKKVAPSRVELLLTASPMIEQACVFGDGRCGLVALIVPATTIEKSGDDRGARSEVFRAEITRCLATAAHEEQIHRFVLLDRPFSIDRGEMTGKLSLCRAVIARNFAAEIQGIPQSQSQESASSRGRQSRGV